MHRFFVADPNIQENTLHLSSNEWHHCRTVLRAQKGDRLILFDGKGTEFLTEIAEMSRSNAVLRIIQKNIIPPLRYKITLAQALPKNKSMDLIIQKSTELSVYEIIPMLADRSVIRLKKSESDSKVRRWREISIEAAKQCGVHWLPKIEHPKTIREMIDQSSHYDLKLIGSLQNNAKPLWEYLTDISPTPCNILIVIGPEGDFTPQEISLAQNAGIQPLNLGPLVLRCDTAAIYTISTLSYELRRRRYSK